MLKIKYYNTNVGVIFKVVDSSYNSALSLKNYCEYINDIHVEDIQELSNKWYKIDSLPICIKKKTSAKKVQVGWELKIPSLASGTIPVPPYLALDELVIIDYDNYKYKYDGKFKDIGELYQQRYETQPEQIVDVPFDLQHLDDIEVSNFNKPEQIKIKQLGGSYGNTTQIIDLSHVVRYEELHELLTPEFLVHNCPCSLSSEQMFKIVRYYVRENIDPRSARITSDYDFCFTVKKILNKQPSFVSKEKKQSSELFEIFEMTWEGYNNKKTGYSGYTPIEALKANSLEDMKNKLESYLKELLDKINCEVEQCSCCKGTGHIVKKIETNFKL